MVRLQKVPAQTQIQSEFRRTSSSCAGDVARPTRQPPALPPNVYTNLQPAPGSNSVNVILMDALNTKLTDQAFVKSDTLAYLKTLTAGTRVAIMTLSNQLRILQGFTQDGAVLAAAVKSKNNRQLSSPLMTTDLDDTNDSLADVVDAGTAAALQEFANETNSFQTGMRNRMTLEALDQIAGYLATIPGRKNLIWFTAGMPLQIFPQGGVNDLATMTDYTKDLRRTTDLLTAAQIAVYPVDAQGLHGNMQASATSAGSGFANGNGGAAMAASNLAFLQKTGAEQLSMVAVAEATGGVAYFNTNGLKEAIAKAIAHGANYYTVSYVPPVAKYDGAFHRISVKVDHPGAKLAYRDGYYSDDIARNEAGGTSLTPAGAPLVDDMAESMRRGVPASSQILFDVRVEPHTGTVNPPGMKPAGVVNPKLQDKPLKRYDVQYIFPARQIMFTDAPNNGHHGALEFEVAAYDVTGTMLSSISQSIELPLATDAYNKLQQSPFQFYQQLDLPPGDIFLRIGIHDITAARVGTLEIPPPGNSGFRCTRPYTHESRPTTASPLYVIVDQPDFFLTAPTSPLVVVPGVVPGGNATISTESASNPEQATVSLTPVLNYSGTITVSCSSPSSYVSCGFTNIASTSIAPTGSVVLNTATAQAATINVQTPATLPSNYSGALRRAGRGDYALALLPFGELALLPLARGNRTRLRRYLWLLALFFAMSFGLTGCTATNLVKFYTPVPEGLQTLTITATDGTITKTFTMSISIQ